MELQCKPFHLCSYGDKFAGEINQCQKPGYKWLEIEPGLFVAFCEYHYNLVYSFYNDKANIT